MKSLLLATNAAFILALAPAGAFADFVEPSAAPAIVCATDNGLVGHIFTDANGNAGCFLTFGITPVVPVAAGDLGDDGDEDD